MATGPRTEKFQVRCTAQELQMLQELSDHTGLSASAIVRLLVRERYQDHQRRRRQEAAAQRQRR